MASRIAPGAALQAGAAAARVDGNLRWFQANAAPTYDADGQLLRWVCVAQDIDSRRRSEMQRLESEAFTRLLLDSANEGFYSIDRNGAVTLCNDAFLKILGFASREEVLGRHLHHVIHHSRPDGSPYPVQECPIQHTAVTGQPRHVEHELFFRVDGSSLPVEYRVAPIFRDGELQGRSAPSATSASAPSTRPCRRSCWN